MRIKLTLKPPFDMVFGFRQTEIEAPEKSTVAEAMRILIDAHSMEEDLRKKNLIGKKGVIALYVIKKEDRKDTVVKSDFILNEMDSLAIHGAILGG